MIITSYFKTGIRNFVANKVSSLINIIGLATTIGIGLVVYLIIDRQLNLDKFHPDHQKIFTVQSVINWDGSEQVWARSPIMVGRSLKDDFQQVGKMARVDVKSGIVRFNEKVFNERISLADVDFLDIFHFPLKHGNKDDFGDKSNIIISEKVAAKYFDDEDPLGKDLKIILDGSVFLFTVAGVAEKFPETASFGFDFLLPIDKLSNLYNVDFDSWKGINQHAVFTFFKLDDIQSLDLIKENSAKYLDLVNKSNEDWPLLDFRFEPLTTIAQNSQYTRECHACGSTPEVIFMFGIISLVLLISACFNYINISVALSYKRLREIALRKVMGGLRKQLIFQFITENLILCFAASVLGLLIAELVFLPGMNRIFGGVGFELNLLENTQLLVFLIGLFLVIGVGSGAYPAWYISAFKPVTILKGKEKMTGKNMLTKVFLTGQFFLTFIAVVSGLIFTQSNKNQEKMDWGYNQDGVLVLPIKNNEQYTVFQQWADQSADILDYSGSINQIGKSNSEEVIDMGTSKFAVDAFLVDFNYPQTMGLRLNWGRFFDENLKSDADQSILVNEKFLDKFGWEELDLPQQRVKINNENYSIIGVVEDFHHFDFFNPITPSIIRIGTEENFKYISLKTNDNTNTENQVKNVWAGKFPDTPYAGFFQEEAFEVFFQNTSVLINIMNFTAFIAIVLSSMGLFGLVSLLIVKRLKELSIRNVLGAKGTDIVMLISKQFLWLFGIALIFAIPVSYILFIELLSQMFLGNPVKLGPGPFVFTLVILVAIIILTVSSHMIQLLRRNPVDSLRLE